MTNTPPLPPADIASAIVGCVDVLLEIGVLDPSSGAGAAAPTGLATGELMAGVVQVEYLSRLVDALRVQVAGEVAARSAAEYGDEGLARSMNFPTAAKFLTANTGTSVATAKKLICLAGKLRTTMSLTGLPNLPAFAGVAEAVSTGSLGLDAARVIVDRLGDVATRTGFTDALLEAEATLVSTAQESLGGLCYSADNIDALAVRMCAHLDPDGAEPREADLHDKRYLTITAQRTGMTRITGLLPPTEAGHLRAALEPFTSPRIPSFPTDREPVDMPTAADTLTFAAAGAADVAAGADAAADAARLASIATITDAATITGAETVPADTSTAIELFPTDMTTPATSTTMPEADLDDPLFRDTRTHGQKLADGLLNLVTAAASLPGMPRLNGAAPTVNLHATLDDVVTGQGIGWIDGLTEPVPYTTVETLLCHADVITTLFGEHGQVISHGKTKRLFTAAQNRALAARDGGCVWPTCEAPPSRCESHHVEGWKSRDHEPGRTDLDNGALLCHFHHSHVHQTRWKLVMRQGTPHLIPPDWLDWKQTPRPCQQNRAREHTRKTGNQYPDQLPRTG